MKVLYVLAGASEADTSVADELASLDPTLEVHTARGAAAALVEIRADSGHRAVFLSPRLPQNEGLALIATLRRDRAPVAVVAIITEAQRAFFAPAINAGADDVLVMREAGGFAADETLRRVRNSRHLERARDQSPLRVLFVGQDQLAWDLLVDLPFVAAEQVGATAEGASPITLSDGSSADVIIIDEQPGESHALQVVKWLNARSPETPLVVLTSATGADVGGAALDLGADDVVSKAGSYRRRLVATLHKQYLRKNPTRPGVRAVPDVPVVPEQMYLELLEAQKFERALRDRDRDELSRLRHTIADERERRIVLENTLRHTEDANGVVRREFEDRLATAADRLNKVATDTQALHNHLEAELSAQQTERERFVNSDLFGYATVTVAGALVRCNAEFARMFGFEGPADALPSPTDLVRSLSDHAHVVQRLEAGDDIARVESVLRRVDGRTFHALTSAAWLPQSGDERLIERILIDMDDRTRVEEQLRLARRLEAAGRLAAEMSGEIEPLLSSIEAGAPEPIRSRASMLVRQMLAFSRRQAKPAGLLSLFDAVRRTEPLLRQIAGDTVSLDFRLADVGTVAAGDDDIEQLLAALVFTAANSLPYGGTLAIETRVSRSGFDQRTELLVSAAGYGVHPALQSASLTRLVTRCGGTVRVTDEPARSTTLHVHLPS